MRKDHPLRAIPGRVDEVFKQLSRRFDTMYGKVGASVELLPAQLLPCPACRVSSIWATTNSDSGVLGDF